MEPRYLGSAAAQPATDKPAGEHVAAVATPATTEADNSRPEQTDAAVRPAATNPVATPTPVATRVADGAPFTAPATGKKDVNMPAANSAPSAISVSTRRTRSMSPAVEHVRRRTSTGHATGSSLPGRDGAHISSTNSTRKARASSVPGSLHACENGPGEAKCVNNQVQPGSHPL